MNSLLVLIMFIVAIVMALLVGFFIGLTFGEQLLPIATHAITQSVTV